MTSTIQTNGSLFQPIIINDSPLGTTPINLDFANTTPLSDSLLVLVIVPQVTSAAAPMDPTQDLVNPALAQVICSTLTTTSDTNHLALLI